MDQNRKQKAREMFEEVAIWLRSETHAGKYGEAAAMLQDVQRYIDAGIVPEWWHE